MSSNAIPTGQSANAKLYSWIWKGLLAIVVIVGLMYGTSALISSSDPASGSSTNSRTPKLTYIVKPGNLNVSVIEQGGLESSENVEIKCKVRGSNTVNWVIENGTMVEPGDVLVRLDTLAIEDAINERSKYAHWSRSGAERSEASLARAKLAVSEYQDGRYVSQLMQLEKNLAIAESNLLTSTNMLEHAQKLSERGFAHDLEIEQRKVTVDQARLDVAAKKTDIEVLKKFTKAMQMKTLEGNLNAAQATHEANEERATLDEQRRDRAKEEFELCVIKAEKKGLVIYPSAAAWKSAPDVAEGASVHKDQVLLLMPNLMKMQVKVGVHESIIKRIEPGMKAKISIPEETFEGKVLSVASVARPAGWWTGNVVKYDTIIELPEGKTGLKPGMSAEVEIIIAQHQNKLRVPVSAILETGTETLCWIKTANGGTQRRVITTGDSNDVFILIEDGLVEGEEVVLNPVAFIKEAQREALRALEEEDEQESDGQDSGGQKTDKEKEDRDEKASKDKSDSDAKS